MLRDLDESAHRRRLPCQADSDSSTVRSVSELSPPASNAWNLLVTWHYAGCHRMVLGCYLAGRGSGADRYFARAWTAR